jgi:hypothetical protein
MLTELIGNMLQSTPQGCLGVTLIGVYFVVIVGAAVYRIGKGEHLQH